MSTTDRISGIIFTRGGVKSSTETPRLILEYIAILKGHKRIWDLRKKKLIRNKLQANIAIL